MNVQALCDRLVANDAALTELYINLGACDAELKLILILDAAKKNKTVKKVSVQGWPDDAMPLNVPVALSLASLVSEHPEIQEIEFDWVKFIEFGPIALAIHQNRNLTRLWIWECQVNPNLVECLRWLLTENTLQSITLDNNDKCDGHPSFDISGALLGNSSLKELDIEDHRAVIRSETFRAIPHMIRTNQDFETLDLSLSKRMDDRYKVVRLLAQAAEGHASLKKLAIDYYDVSSNKRPSAEDLINRAGTAEAIGIMLHNAPALREFSLSGCYMGSAGARHLADGLSSKKSVVESLNLSRNELGDAEAGIFARVLLAKQNLKSLGLNTNHIGDAGALELAVALRQNNTLEHLGLSKNQIGSDGTSALADALVTNNALKYLSLTIGDDGATSIAEMLTRNESIENVCIEGFCEKGLKAFATRLSSMNGLKTLRIEHRNVRGYTSEIGKLFILALEQNTTLETFDFMRNEFEDMPQVNFLLALNRGGRRLLSATGESVPPLNYWPRILARSSDNADMLFYFLCEIPNVLVAKAGSREGGDHDETNY
jgi:Ran GTPase-activating protein (RanGAP) involved in mRNA processing and transport